MTVGASGLRTEQVQAPQLCVAQHLGPVAHRPIPSARRAQRTLERGEAARDIRHLHGARAESSGESLTVIGRLIEPLFDFIQVRRHFNGVLDRFQRLNLQRGRPKNRVSPSVKPSSALWQDSQAICLEAERIGSENSLRPSAIFSGVEGLSGGAGRGSRSAPDSTKAAGFAARSARLRHSAASSNTSAMTSAVQRYEISVGATALFTTPTGPVRHMTAFRRAEARAASSMTHGGERSA